LQKNKISQTPEEVRSRILKAFPHLKKKDVDTAKEGQSGV